jgi:hypothetical protein
MDKTQEWAMKRWRKNRTSSEFLRQQQQKMTKKLWKVSCDKALQLVRTTADIPVVTPKSDRPKKSPRDSQPKNRRGIVKVLDMLHETYGAARHLREALMIRMATATIKRRKTVGLL